MNSFIDQHQGMIDLADEILATARDTGPIVAMRLARLRLELARAVSDHVTAEIAFLARNDYAQRLDQPTTTRYHDELLRWRQAFMTCNCDWPPQRIQADQSGFSRAFRPIVHALRERICWEEGQLYPQLLAAAA